MTLCSWDSAGQLDAHDRALRCLRGLHDTLDSVRGLVQALGTWC